ncbi:MAG: hypothetical protein ACT4ON_10845 [Bacteroidota bacterium]
MISIKLIRTSIALLVITFAINTTGVAQCKTLIKEGIKKLAPYTHNGQVNNMTESAAQSLEVNLSFYKGLNYKLQICAEVAVGPVQFKVLDEEKTEIYNSSETKADNWEFVLNSSQQLTVIISFTSKDPAGCIAVLVGIKSNTANPIRNL